MYFSTANSSKNGPTAAHKLGFAVLLELHGILGQPSSVKTVVPRGILGQPSSVKTVVPRGLTGQIFRDVVVGQRAQRSGSHHISPG